MALMSDSERPFVEAVARLALCNPFLPERVDAERDALGPDFVSAGNVWHARADERPESPNLGAINERAKTLAQTLRGRLVSGTGAGPDELRLYEDLVLYLLYTEYDDDFHQVIEDRTGATARISFSSRFLRDVRFYLDVPGAKDLAVHDPAHLFALGFQIRRAFHFTFRNILGASLPAARLRAAVWQSIFTHDIHRYRRSLYRCMGDVATLIVGPSGTGKELVAQAIGLARYIPFDPGKQAFVRDFSKSFFPLNLSALPTTLIESELFGHKRGAFTGAVQDRQGRLDLCPAAGTVFLDEIAEVDAAIQVKLLRVLQARTFQRLGDAEERRFTGKIIAATNRDLGSEMGAGRFREDLYYRLCSDVIETPALERQLRDSPDELSHLLLFLASRIAGEEEAQALSDQAGRWIVRHLGQDYRWPGNVRELEQCVRNIMIRGEYRPAGHASATPGDSLIQGVLSGSMSADAVLRSYCTLVYAQTTSYQETARRLGLDRRTVRQKVDADLLRRLRAEVGEPGRGR